LRFPVPLTTSPGLAPCEAARHFRPGSALRLSQPLSGFLAGPSFVALSRATTVCGIPPFRGFPSPEIACPSRGSMAPLQSSTSVQRRTTRDLVAAGFADARAFARLPGSSRRLWVPFRLAEASFPVALGLVPRNRLVPPASPASKLHSLLRVRSRRVWVSPHLPVDPLLGFCPSRASLPHASESLPARARGLVHVPSSEDSGTRRRGPRPSVPGEAVPAE
jgi:hypothetical protein